MKRAALIKEGVATGGFDPKADQAVPWLYRRDISQPVVPRYVTHVHQAMRFGGMKEHDFSNTEPGGDEGIKELHARIGFPFKLKKQ